MAELLEPLDQEKLLDCGTDTVCLSVAGARATLRLNRPQQLNTMNAELLAGFSRALDLLAAHDELSVVVLTGTGRAFCAGGDLRDRPGREVKTQAEDEHRLRGVGTTSERLLALRQITIAAINGPCAGGGLAWAAACDLRLAHADALFNTAYLQIDLPGDLGTTWLLSSILGSARTRDWCLRPRKISSAEALTAGFVSSVEAPGDFVPAVSALSAELASRNSAALKALKENFRDAQTWPLKEYLDRETARHVGVRFAKLAAMEAPSV
jgi:2-(1,2-epoxy-1,2-dihydrophenyl)acetyl-CoA isomerase